MAQKRKDKNRVVLRKGESYRETDNRYMFRWTDRAGKRHSVYAATLDELREKEKTVANDIYDGIKAEGQNITVNQLFSIWKEVKRGLKNTTFQNYCYMYGMFVANSFGKKQIRGIKSPM